LPAGSRNRNGVARGVTALGLAALALAQTGAAPARKTPSGLPVPRYVSLKFSEVNARGGPGEDYRLLWTYRTKGLPLQVVAETYDWRRICDPEGSMAWVKRTAVESRRTVMRAAAEPLTLRRRPDESAGVAAVLNGRSIASLGDCRGGWCRVSAGRAEGWAPASSLWGVDENPQCRPPAPPQKRK
jgi:SH3-like domain-containing protein